MSFLVGFKFNVFIVAVVMCLRMNVNSHDSMCSVMKALDRHELLFLGLSSKEIS